MSGVAIRSAELLNLLPENDQEFAYEFIKKLVKAWDPDFTKLTYDEAIRLEDAESNEFVSEQDVDWENLSQYA